MHYSLIIPTYNCEKYVDDGIQSVLCQFTDDCELIVVDDGSTDHTRACLSRYESCRNVTVVYNSHKGASNARNTGLQLARGTYVSFLDCDDRLKSLPFLKHPDFFAEHADLYIFGIERVFLSGEKESWTVPDRVFQTASDFADAYIREHKFLIYSNGNKLYRKSIINRLSLRFDERISFGEDRLFNYHYLKGCGKIVTSSTVIYEYLQRSTDSMSGRTIHGYFNLVRNLHKAKIDCFMSLSKGCSREERAEFVSYDLCREIEWTIDRFQQHPGEQNESVSEINKLIFTGEDDPVTPVDVLVIAGSPNCEYKVRRALELGAGKSNLYYIASGGNPHSGGTGTEAEFMYSYLLKHGIPKNRIILENNAKNTEQNLRFSYGIIRKMEAAGHFRSENVRIGVVTAAFHLPRTKLIAESIEGLPRERIFFFSAAGPSTAADNWFLNDSGKRIVLKEFKKQLYVSLITGEQLISQIGYSMEAAIS